MVFDHRDDRPLIDAEVVDVEPALRRIDVAVLTPSAGPQRRIEGIEEAVLRDRDCRRSARSSRASRRSTSSGVKAIDEAAAVGAIVPSSRISPAVAPRAA